MDSFEFHTGPAGSEVIRRLLARSPRRNTSTNFEGARQAGPRPRRATAPDLLVLGTPPR